MTSPGDFEPDFPGPGPGPTGERVHPLVPPLALAVITLIGAAIVIGFGHPGSSSKPVVKRAILYGGGKLPRRPHGGGGPKKPVETPVAAPRWLARALGGRNASAPLVHDVSRDLRITITDRGFRIDYRGAHIARYATGLDRLGRPVRYVNGVLRRLALGADVTVVRDSVTNAYLLVGQRFGSRTWTWHLATNLRPRIRGDGALVLTGPESFLVQPPQIFDRRGKDVSPRGLRWGLAREPGGYRLSVLLVDRRLPLPYVISG